MFIGAVLPMLILSNAERGSSHFGLISSSVMMIIGGLSHIYVIIVGGQSYPLSLFPGYEASSSFADGQFAQYMPSMPELLLGLAGISIAMFMTGFAMKLLPFLPSAVKEQ